MALIAEAAELSIEVSMDIANGLRQVLLATAQAKAAVPLFDTFCNFASHVEGPWCGDPSSRSIARP